MASIATILIFIILACETAIDRDNSFDPNASLALQSKGEIHGRVTIEYAQSGCFYGVEIIPFQDGTRVNIEPGTSKEDGRFKITDLTPGKYDLLFTLEREKGETDFENITISDVEVGAGEIKILPVQKLEMRTITLKGEVEIEGVADKSGVKVNIRRKLSTRESCGSGDDSGDDRNEETTSSGSYKFEYLPFGDYEITALKEGYYFKTTPERKYCTDNPCVIKVHKEDYTPPIIKLYPILEEDFDVRILDRSHCREEEGDSCLLANQLLFSADGTIYKMRKVQSWQDKDSLRLTDNKNYLDMEDICPFMEYESDDSIALKEQDNEKYYITDRNATQSEPQNSIRLVIKLPEGIISPSETYKQNDSCGEIKSETTDETTDETTAIYRDFRVSIERHEFGKMCQNIKKANWHPLSPDYLYSDKKVSVGVETKKEYLVMPLVPLKLTGNDNEQELGLDDGSYDICVQFRKRSVSYYEKKKPEAPFLISATRVIPFRLDIDTEPPKIVKACLTEDALDEEDNSKIKCIGEDYTKQRTLGLWFDGIDENEFVGELRMEIVNEDEYNKKSFCEKDFAGRYFSEYSSHTFSAGDSIDGEKKKFVSIRVVDGVGNVKIFQSEYHPDKCNDVDLGELSVFLDSTIPEQVQIQECSEMKIQNTNPVTIEFNPVTDNNLDYYQYLKQVGESASDWPSIDSDVNKVTSTQISVDVSEMETIHKISIRAVDKAKNIGTPSEVCSFAVDNRVPKIGNINVTAQGEIVASGSEVSIPTLDIAVDIDEFMIEDVKFKGCKGGAKGISITPTDEKNYTAYAKCDIEEGSNSLSVIVTDKAGNSSSNITIGTFIYEPIEEEECYPPSGWRVDWNGGGEHNVWMGSDQCYGVPVRDQGTGLPPAYAKVGIISTPINTVITFVGPDSSPLPSVEKIIDSVPSYIRVPDGGSGFNYVCFYWKIPSNCL